MTNRAGQAACGAKVEAALFTGSRASRPRGEPMRKFVRIASIVAVIGGVLFANHAQAVAPKLELTEFTVDEKALCELRDQWIDDLLKTHEHGTWATMEMELTDAQLEKVDLPPADVLRAGDYSQPTLVTK